MKGYVAMVYRRTIPKSSLNEDVYFVPTITVPNLFEKEVPRDGIEPPTRGFSVPCSTD
jgi:hypothetical protein